MLCACARAACASLCRAPRPTISPAHRTPPSPPTHLQGVNLSMVPLAYRVLVINGCSLFWSAYLSSMANSGPPAVVTTAGGAAPAKVQ